MGGMVRSTAALAVLLIAILAVVVPPAAGQVSTFKPGDEVAYDVNGSWTGYVIAKAGARDLYLVSRNGTESVQYHLPASRLTLRNAGAPDPLAARISRLEADLARLQGAVVSLEARVEALEKPAPPPPPDGDGDGVPDDQDECPSDPGSEPNGCDPPPPPPDTDGDGFPDSSDLCPSKPGVAPDGCPPIVLPPDIDGDGVPDNQDACPNEAGSQPDGCNPPPSSCDQTVSSATALVNAAGSAANGTVICVSGGSYGTVNFWNRARTGFVTIRPVSGAHVSITPSVGNWDYLRFVGVTVPNSGLVNNCSTHIHFVDVTFSWGLLITNYGFGCPSGNQDYLVDGSTFDRGGRAGYEGRLSVTDADGFVVRDSTFSGVGPEASDGVFFNGNTRNSTVGPGNTFTGILQSACGATHCDSIQFYGAGPGNRVAGNLFRNSDVFFMGSHLPGSSLIFEDNVFDGAGGSYLDKIQFGSASSPTFRHNTVRNVRVSFDSKVGNPATTNAQARDNVMVGSSSFKTSNGAGCSGCVFESNLFDDSADARGTRNVIATPQFAGPLDSYAGWRLAPVSPGKAAGSDGADMGIR
jgi:Thrombospondin type 3 repeat